MEISIDAYNVDGVHCAVPTTTIQSPSYTSKRMKKIIKFIEEYHYQMALIIGAIFWLIMGGLYIYLAIVCDAINNECLREYPIPYIAALVTFGIGLIICMIPTTITFINDKCC